MSNFISQIYIKEAKKGKSVVFLDRDGTIVKDVHYLSDKEQVKFLPGAIEFIRKLNKEKILVIVITNQAVVARGYVSIAGLKEINNHIYSQLSKKGASINAIYSCPHHPNADLEKFRIKCTCRKPGLAMFQKAVNNFNINLDKAYLIGDTTGDIKAGKRLKVTTFLLKTGYAGADYKYKVKPDYICDSFKDVLDKIIK